MRPFIIGTIYKKEMLDLVRDRRSLISMAIVPLLVFPLLVAFPSTTVLLGVSVFNPVFEFAAALSP